jgi:hypothetical protein
MDVVPVLRIVALLASPTVIIWAGIQVPKLVRWQVNAQRERKQSRNGTNRIPIEQLAADLRRLLARYEAVRRSPQLAMRAHHLWALEAALADCACAAADSLGVPHQPRPPHGRLPVSQLHQLLRDLADAGLVLPANVRWLTADG